MNLLPNELVQLSVQYLDDKSLIQTTLLSKRFKRIDLSTEWRKRNERRLKRIPYHVLDNDLILFVKAQYKQELEENENPREAYLAHLSCIDRINRRHKWQHFKNRCGYLFLVIYGPLFWPICACLFCAFSINVFLRLYQAEAFGLQDFIFFLLLLLFINGNWIGECIIRVARLDTPFQKTTAFQTKTMAIEWPDSSFYHYALEQLSHVSNRSWYFYTNLVNCIWTTLNLILFCFKACGFVDVLPSLYVLNALFVSYICLTITLWLDADEDELLKCAPLLVMIPMFVTWILFIVKLSMNVLALWGVLLPCMASCVLASFIYMCLALCIRETCIKRVTWFTISLALAGSSTFVILFANYIDPNSPESYVSFSSSPSNSSSSSSFSSSSSSSSSYSSSLSISYIFLFLWLSFIPASFLLALKARDRFDRLEKPPEPKQVINKFWDV